MNAVKREQFEKWSMAALPGLLFLLLIEIAAAVLRAPTLLWNEVRICRSVAMLHGISLYPAKNSAGPVIGTLHAPVSHCFYLLAAWLATPSALITAGSVLSVLAVFGALAWVLRHASGDSRETAKGTWFSFVFCGLLIMESAGTYNTVTMIHTDAPALLFATLGCGILCGRNERWTGVQLWIAGVACTLVVGCKQTLAPVPMAVMLFIAIVGGWRDAVRFLVALIVSAAVVLAAIAVSVSLSAFFFNTVAMAAHRALKPDFVAVLAASFRAGRLEALPALFPILAFVLYGTVFSEQRATIEAFLKENRWVVFAVTGIFLVPVCAKAIMTVGADVNHLGLVLYFFFVAAALAIQQNLYSPAALSRMTARVSAVIGILVSIAPGAALSIPESVRHFHENASEAAYCYVARHGTSTYFPLNPAAALLARGKLYHFDVALFDRELGGAPLTEEQIQSGLPADLERMALPPGEALSSAALRQVVAGWSRASDTELRGWTILRRRR